MEIRAVHTLNQNPRVTIDVVLGIDPQNPQNSKIEVRYENMPDGWVAVVPVLYGALGAALPEAFAQLLHTSATQEDQKRIVVVPEMSDLRRKL